jgi:DNA (cytosine-5)-methyltransferase 1
MKLKVLDLFSGIGGFSLGLERTGGFETVAFCEIDPFCRQVLAKHWPEVPVHDDVQTVSADWLAEMGAWPDVICGGFPCQDLSYAGKGAGLAGERSGLWREYARLIGEIRPRYVLVENVAALLGRGLGDVLGDLAALGYDAEWRIISAADVGAPHLRERVWIMAYPASVFRDGSNDYTGCCGEGPGTSEAISKPGDGGCNQDLANPDSQGLEGRIIAILHERAGQRVAGARGPSASTPTYGRDGDANWWLVEPDVGRVAHGISSRVDRLKALGNAVVPQIPELIGRAILEVHR